MRAHDVYREAERLAVALNGVRVSVSGGFDTATWKSTGISYSVVIDGGSPVGDLEPVVVKVDDVAEIPRAIRAGATVVRARFAVTS